MPGAPELKKKINKSKPQNIKWLFLATLFLFLFSAGFFIWWLTFLPSGMVAPGVSAGPFDLGDLSADEASLFLQNQLEAKENSGVDFIYQNKTITLTAVLSSFGGTDLAYQIFDYKIEKMLEEINNLGRQGSWQQKIKERFLARLNGHNIPLVFTLDEEKARRVLEENFNVLEKQPISASLQAVFDSSANQRQILIQPEQNGQVFDYTSALRVLRQRLATLEALPIVLTLRPMAAAITLAEAEKLRPEAEALLAKGALIFAYQNQEWKVEPTQWLSWLKASKNAQAFLDFDDDKLMTYLKELIPNLEAEAQEPRFVMKDNKVMEFSPGQPGARLNFPATKLVIWQVLAGALEKVEVKAEISKPLSQVANLNDLGITEIIGIGRSNFAGSPVNRRHNIKIGSQSLNGILIAPNETFSLLKALGKVDAEHGYRPELVIKGNKTIPEFGGGLCQIGTTMFRVALASGLPIVERQNHSYRVPYYEPPVGVDATIYNPKPDLRFLNDSGHYILIQTRLEGNELIFEFWGKQDGRQAVNSESKMFNIKAPPPSKLIETLDLPVGKKKCTEKPHYGANAVFIYTVTYADGTVKTQEFKSHYRPWGEVCLIGVEKLSEPAVDGMATSTIPYIP